MVRFDNDLMYKSIMPRSCSHTKNRKDWALLSDGQLCWTRDKLGGMPQKTHFRAYSALRLLVHDKTERIPVLEDFHHLPQKIFTVRPENDRIDSRSQSIEELGELRELRRFC